MSILVKGVGAVSPAGWGASLLAKGRSDEPRTREIRVPGQERPACSVRDAPAPPEPPPFLRHPRFRRSSPISRFAAAAGLEAIGADVDAIRDGTIRLGVLFCTMTGSVQYTARFYDETAREPATASPVLFPETVFNSPASHLAALLNSPNLNYTLIGGPATFLDGIAMAAGWLIEKQVDTCLVLGAEEAESLACQAAAHFERDLVLAEGAGALYLAVGTPSPGQICLDEVTSPRAFWDGPTKADAARRMVADLAYKRERAILVDGLTGVTKWDQAEAEAWSAWQEPRYSPKKRLGEGFAAASAWQCVTAARLLESALAPEALVSIVGCSQHAAGVRWRRAS